MAVAIFFTGDLLRECALSSRISAFDQGRRLGRLGRLVAITYLSRHNWTISAAGHILQAPRPPGLQTDGGRDLPPAPD
jgi:hypothetical protein